MKIDFYNLAQKMAEKIETEISSMNDLELKKMYRRDYDGVSSGEYLLGKLIAEFLTDGKIDTRGLSKCDDDEDVETGDL